MSAGNVPELLAVARQHARQATGALACDDPLEAGTFLFDAFYSIVSALEQMQAQLDRIEAAQ